ncbi:MAG TPA: ABC transporter ATP-binding protein [Ktedonobacteraceae bacterium]|nr:ABC transporter ATP-binding protein [Ktedonobacteraceae bacterium]
MQALIDLRSYLLRYRVAILGGFLLLICANLVALTQPYLVGVAVDSLHLHGNASVLLRYALYIAGLAAIQAVFSFTGRFILSWFARRAEYELRADLFKHFEKLELDYYQHNKVGDLVARATNDLTAIRGLLGPGISNLLNTALSVSATVTFMFTIDVRLTLYTALLLPLITVFFIGISGQIRRSYKRVQDQFGDVSAMAQENLSGIRVVKAYQQEDHELEAFRAANRKYVDLSIRYTRFYAILWPAMFFLESLATAVIFWVGGQDVLAGRISIGQLVQFIGYLAQLAWPMIALGWVVNLFQQGSASMIRIKEVMEHQPTIADPPALQAAASPAKLRGDVEFRHVSFAYGEHEVLHDINIRVKAGSSLAIVGPTGSGKSSLVNLVPRLFDTTQGQVLIDGYDVRDLPLALLRREVGHVPQETFLFSVPLEENIGFGVEQLTPARIQEVMEISQLAKDVEDFPHGTATMIGERGVTLSGGQKQRASLARAVAKDPAILILDDAMSSVDTHTEAEILRHLHTVMQKRTTIVISHRCSTVKNLDHIVVLDQGRILEEGSHESLLQRRGLYAEMYRRQLIGEELEGNIDGDLFSGR